MRHLYHWHHVYADGDWKPGLSEHLTALRSSGLYDNLDHMFVGIVGDWCNRDDVIDFLQFRRIDCTVIAEADEGYEQVTLHSLAKEAISNLGWVSGMEALVLYSHSKGAAYPSVFNDSWRRAMQDKCIDEWRSVIEQMSTHKFDTAGAFFVAEPIYAPEVPLFAGVHGASTVINQINKEMGGILEYVEEPHPIGMRLHYSGNYWWATMNWIRKLPYRCPTTNRHEAEFWIGCAEDGVSLPRALDLRPGSAFDQLRAVS